MGYIDIYTYIYIYIYVGNTAGRLILEDAQRNLAGRFRGDNAQVYGYDALRVWAVSTEGIWYAGASILVMRMITDFVGNVISYA